MFGCGCFISFMVLLGLICVVFLLCDFDVFGYMLYMMIDYCVVELLVVVIIIFIIERLVEDILFVVGGGKDYYVEVIDSWLLWLLFEDL